MPWLEGRTESGTHVLIEHDPYIDWFNGDPRTVVVDGERVETGRVSRLRDGETTDIPTPAGHIRRPAPRTRRPATIDGEILIGTEPA